MSLFEEKNKIIKHNQFTEAFKSDPKKQDENDENNENNENQTESKSNEKEGKQIEKRSLQIEEFTKRSTTPTRFDYAFYNKNDKNDKKHENEEESLQKNLSNTSQSQDFIYDERLKDPIRRSYFKSNKTNNKTNKDNPSFIDYRAYQFKVIMLGNIAVGKTCLLSFFVDSLFKDNYSCTVGVDFKVKTVVLSDNLKVDLQIWDTSGEERFRTITKQYYRDAAGIVLVFDVTNEKSFSDLEKWVDEINSTAKRNVNVVLIGNKADLTSERVVSYERASRFASQKGIEYYEASAKTGQQVEEVYFRLSGNMVNSLEEEEMKEGKDEKSIVMDSSKADVSVGDGFGNLNGKNGNLKIGSRKKNKNCCGG